MIYISTDNILSVYICDFFGMVQAIRACTTKEVMRAYAQKLHHLSQAYKSCFLVLTLMYKLWFTIFTCTCSLATV